MFILNNDKIKSAEYKNLAITNIHKYLELNPEAEDKGEVEEFIKDLNEVEKEEQPVLLKG